MNNNQFLIDEIKWLEKIIIARANQEEINLPNWRNKNETLPRRPYFFLKELYNTDILSTNIADRILITSVLSCQKECKIFNHLINLKKGGEIKHIGGLLNQIYDGFCPTLQTICFVIAGNNFKEYLFCMNYFQNKSKLIQKGLIFFEKPMYHSPFADKIVKFESEFYDYILNNKKAIERLINK